ncbi:MAG: Fpg/Nei family DNA glycosylase [Rubrobacter sp.]|nr:Fpg/Nei family DNA glycosylase [Rubrobacter sp.]
MPELPEADIFRWHLEGISPGRKVGRVRVKDRRVPVGASVRGLQSAPEGRRLCSTRRHGKNLFAGIEGGGWLLLHFGMTGSLRYLRNGEEEPPHVRLLLAFAGGGRLAFADQRVLGRVYPVGDPERFVEEKGLGPDALELDYPSFRERVGGRRGAVKSVLMNQGVIAGLGNIYSDEVLFQARLHPGTSAAHLKEAELRRLFEAIRSVLWTAIEKGVDPDELPGYFLLPRRREGERCPRGNGGIRKMRAAGRTAYYCPACQPESRGGSRG